VVPESKKPQLPKILPEHESGVRRMVADAHGTPYRAFVSLAEAKSCDDGVAVFEGDYGGQVYLVVRASYIRCSELALQHLLADLDERSWRDASGARVYYEEQPIGAGISGGMGGARVNSDVWVHKELRGFEPAIRRILTGQQIRLND
jgi:hypothetical protein